MRVVDVDPGTDSRWDSFVTSHPDALVYHHPAWLEALSFEYPRRSAHLGCEDGRGRLQGVLPLLYTPGVPLRRANPITGRRLSSLPRTPVAGPLATDAEVAATLVRHAVERVRDEPGVQLQVKVGEAKLDGLANGLIGAQWGMTYVRELPEDADALRFGNSRNHSRIHWAVRKAERMGVRVRTANSRSELRAWYQLYLATMRAHLVPPRPYRFFEALWELLRPRGLMQLLIAEQHDPAPTVLAGSILLMFGRTVFFAFNGRREESLPLRPNDAIHWQAMHDACRTGFRHYDFGEVIDNPGLASYKSKWGAAAKWLYRYNYPVRASGDRSTPPSASLGRTMGRALWHHLPLSVTAVVGDRVWSFS